jgi:hypothetical protein
MIAVGLGIGSQFEASIQCLPRPITLQGCQIHRRHGKKLTWDEALQHNASLLWDDGLYEAFEAQKRQYHGRKAPQIIGTMTEYLGSLVK